MEADDLVLENKIMICLHCEKAIDDENSSYCSHCDKPLAKPAPAITLVACPECGEKISKKATICVNCGLPKQPSFAEKAYKLLLVIAVASLTAAVIGGIYLGYQHAQVQERFDRIERLLQR